MVTGNCNRNSSIFFAIYRLELLIPPSNTMLKLLDILFVIFIFIFLLFDTAYSKDY